MLEGAFAKIFGARVPENVAFVRDQIERSPLTNAEQREALLAAAERFAGAQLELPKATGRTALPRHATPARQVAMDHVKAANRKSGELDAVISAERACALFEQIAAAPDIPHTFVHEGCHHRAHVAAKRIENEGVYTEKVWVQTSGADLRIDTPHSPLGYTIAIFHSAVVVHVDRGWNETERMVLDPSLFDGPVTVEAWQSRLSALDHSPTDTYFTSRFVHHISQFHDTPPTEWLAEDLERARAWNRDYKKAEAAMKDIDFEAHLVELVEEARKAYGEKP